MSDLDAILSGQEPAAEPHAEVIAEPAAPEPVAPEPAQERVEQHVPLPTFLDMRDRLKTAEQQLKALQTQPVERVPAPDVIENPDGFAAHVEEKVRFAAVNARLDMSEMLARQSFGDELVDAALQDAIAQGVNQRFVNERNPYGALVAWHKQTQLASEIGNDPAAYRAKVEAEVRAKVEAEYAAKQAAALVAKIPASLANTNGSGGQSDPGWSGPTPLSKLLKG